MSEHDETQSDARRRYVAAVHAMQSGVAAKMTRNPRDTQPKHLRAGVNSAMVEHAALVRVLLNAGVISQRDYYVALADAMEDEVDLYQRELSALLGSEVTLR